MTPSNEPPKVTCMSILSGLRINHAREQLARIVDKLQRDGVTNEEIKIAFDAVTMRNE